MNKNIIKNINLMTLTNYLLSHSWKLTGIEGAKSNQKAVYEKYNCYKNEYFKAAVPLDGVYPGFLDEMETAIKDIASAEYSTPERLAYFLANMDKYVVVQFGDWWTYDSYFDTKEEAESFFRERKKEFIGKLDAYEYEVEKDTESLFVVDCGERMQVLELMYIRTEDSLEKKFLSDIQFLTKKASYGLSQYIHSLEEPYVCRQYIDEISEMVKNWK